MKRGISALYARTFCHATEDIDKVRAALTNAFGDCDIEVHWTAGHHGNPLSVLECSVQDGAGIFAFFSKLAEDDMRQLLRTLDERIDGDCNLFLRVDKQLAYQGIIKTASGEDVLSVRAKVQSFPARRENAVEAAGEYLTGVLERVKASS